MAHSPGPWHSTFNSAKERGVRNSGGFICFLPKVNHYTGQDLRYEEELIESRDNAIAIAALPDLLEALELCFPYMHDLDAENFDDASAGIIEDYKLSEAFRKMKAAIEKAKGAEIEDKRTY